MSNDRFFNKKHKYEILFPIQNLELEGKSFTVGNVQFFVYTEYQSKKYMKKIKETLEKNPHYKNKPRKIKNALKQFGIFYRDEKSINSIFAKTHIYGRIEEAYEKAYEKVSSAINVLKLYREINDDFYRRYFGIKGEVISNDLRIVLRHTTNMEGFIPTMERIGFLYPFRIDRERKN